MKLVCPKIWSRAIVGNGNMAKWHYLLSSSMSQDSPVLQNEGRLSDLPLWPLFRPMRRLQLHLPIDARKMPALLQNCLQE